MHLHKNIKNPLYSAFQYSGFSIKLQLLNVFQAENETRTHDPYITSEVLYRLSYFSLCCNLSKIDNSDSHSI